MNQLHLIPAQAQRLTKNAKFKRVSNFCRGVFKMNVQGLAIKSRQNELVH